MTHVELRVERADGPACSFRVDVRRLLLAGYTGRDRRRVLEHVRELEALGVAPPARIPSVFDVDPALVRVTDEIEVSGTQTSGKVEVVLVQTGSERLVGVGSDHTDRAHEAIDVDEAKAMCPKPVAGVAWRHRDVAPHWDRLELRSWVTEGPRRRLYQEGTLADFLPVEALLGTLSEAGFGDPHGTVVFGGTLPALGGLTYGDRFEMELRDPVLGRSISCAYGVTVPRPPSDDGARPDGLASDA